MKGLAHKIHDHWQKSAAVQKLLPASRLFTGRAKGDPPMPYASLTVPLAAGTGRTNASMYADRQVRIQIWDDDYDDAEAIAQAVHDAFENIDFTMDRGQVIDLIPDEPFGVEEDDPTETVWQFVCQFTAKVARTRAQ